MSPIAVVILIFSILGALDYLIGNKIGVGKEFIKAFSLFAPMAMTMLGMIVIAPAIGAWLSPVFDGFYNIFKIDPSIIPASLFANDMGGVTLAESICKSESIGAYNAFVVSSMMGCVISYTLPFSLGVVNQSRHKELFFGLLCGIATIPIGCFVSGLICKISPAELLLNLLPLIIIAIIIGVALVFAPNVCVKCLSAFGFFMKLLAILGLVFSIFTFLTKIEISPYFDSFENAALICASASVTLSGALPLMFIVTKLLGKPINKLGSLIGISSISTVTLLGTLVTNTSTFGVMNDMDKKGVVLNSAFAVSAAFVFGSHLAFTMALDSEYVLPMMVGKLISGVCAVILACLIYKDDVKASDIPIER